MPLFVRGEGCDVLVQAQRPVLLAVFDLEHRRGKGGGLLLRRCDTMSGHWRHTVLPCVHQIDNL